MRSFADSASYGGLWLEVTDLAITSKSLSRSFRTLAVALRESVMLHHALTCQLIQARCRYTCVNGSSYLASGGTGLSCNHFAMPSAKVDTRHIT